MTQQDYSIDAIAAPAGSLLIGGELPPPSITFSTKDVNEIAKFTEDGFYYKGEFIDDAGEVHRLLKEVLGQMKTDLNPVDAMTTLSPAAQAVLDSANSRNSYGPDDCLNESRWIAAAALRAAVDQVVPQRREPMYADSSEESTWTAQQDTRAELLAIADELENQ